MGMRIHKAMGYAAIHPNREALDDFLYEQADQPGRGLHEVDNFLKEHLAQMPDTGDVSMKRLSLRLETMYPGMPAILENSYPGRFMDIIHYAAFSDTEGAPHIIIPPSRASDWFRRDSSLDYEEYWLNHDEPLDLISPIHRPLYPYLSWMDPKTGETLRDYSKIRDRDRFVETLGYAPVPVVPLAVRLIAEHVGFPDWKLLRPVIATWWN